MKTFISRLLLLAAGILCLSCGTSAKGNTIDKEKIEALQRALKNASEKSKPATIEAAFNEAISLVEIAIKPAKPQLDEYNNLTFDYADKSFVLKDDGKGAETSHILYGKTKIVLFVLKAKETEKKK